MFGHPLADDCTVDNETGETLPVVTIVTDSRHSRRPVPLLPVETFIELHPELHHVRTRIRTPGQNGSRERGFGTPKYERLFLDEINDAVMLATHAEEYRIEYNQVRPHQALAWNRPQEVHQGLANPRIPTFHTTKSCQLLDAGHSHTSKSPDMPGRLTVVPRPSAPARSPSPPPRRRSSPTGTPPSRYSRSPLDTGPDVVRPWGARSPLHQPGAPELRGPAGIGHHPSVRCVIDQCVDGGV